MSREEKFCKEANIFTSWRRKRIVFCPHCARGFNFYVYKLSSEEDFERIKNQEKVEVATWNIIHLFQLCNSRPCFFVKFTTSKTKNTKEGITRFHFKLFTSAFFILVVQLCIMCQILLSNIRTKSTSMSQVYEDTHLSFLIIDLLSSLHGSASAG